MSLSDDKNAIREMVARYSQLFDQGDAHGWAALFVADGEVVVDTNPPVTGPPALAEFLAGIDTHGMRHFAINEIISIGDGTAHCSSALLVTRGQPPTVIMTGSYEDDFVLREGEWRFQRRVMTPDR